MSETKYEIVKKIGVLSTAASGWAKELNLISWNEREAKYDPLRPSVTSPKSCGFMGGLALGVFCPTGIWLNYNK